MPEPIRLADLDPRRIAVDVLNLVHLRVLRDTARLGLVIHMASEGQDETEARIGVFAYSVSTIPLIRRILTKTL
jgi:S-adenosylmethionine:diacylglycerol 3-amino-3-carboxypropyl transferase